MLNTNIITVVNNEQKLTGIIMYKHIVGLKLSDNREYPIYIYLTNQKIIGVWDKSLENVFNELETDNRIVGEFL